MPHALHDLFRHTFTCLSFVTDNDCSLQATVIIITITFSLCVYSLHVLASLPKSFTYNFVGILLICVIACFECKRSIQSAVYAKPFGHAIRGCKGDYCTPRIKTNVHENSSIIRNFL